MSGLPLPALAVVFVVAAAAIWWAGTRLEDVAGRIAARTGLGQAFTGVVLLATATSLPEVATTLTAVLLLDNATLAVHNLVGGVAFQTALIAVADFAKRDRGAMTSFAPRYVLLVQGVGLVLALQVVVAGISADGAPALFGVSVWLPAVVAIHVGITLYTYRARNRPRWRPVDNDGANRMTPGAPQDQHGEGPEGEPGADRRGGSNEHGDDDAGDKGDDKDEGATDDAARVGVAALWLRFVALSAVVLVAGWAAASTADVLAEQTGLGAAFLGATLLAAATSLPELSTTIAAARKGRYTTAVSNVLGSNSFDVSLLFLAELLHRGPSILQDVEWTVTFIAAIGGAMTCVYLWGMLERRDRTTLGVGRDSLAVLLLYAVSVVVLLFAR